MNQLADVVVLIPGKLPDYAQGRLDRTFKVLRLPEAAPLAPDLAAGVRGVAVGLTPVTAGLMQSLPHLEIIANYGVGYDGIDTRYAVSRGIMVTNTPDVVTEEVADAAVGLLLNTVRELPRAENWLREGRWVTQGPYPLTKATLRNRKIGIFGLGRIGRAVAHRLSAFGLPIAYHSRNPVKDCEYAYHPTILQLAAAVDTLICTAPGGPTTLGVIDADVFKALGPDGIFINVGRGGVVNEPALIDALSSGVIRSAGLDVFAHQPHVSQALLSLPNVTLQPHMGTATVYTREAMADLMVDNLLSWFSTGKPLTPIPEMAGSR